MLVVGVGSDLRSDDAAGRVVVADLVARHPGLGADVRSIHQLTPEIADDMTARALVVVVDASAVVSVVTTTEVAANADTRVTSHHVDVDVLIRLAGQLGDPPERVVTVAIPAHDLGIGTELSERTAATIGAAGDVVRRLILGETRSRRSGRTPRPRGPRAL